ncbi:hypothetical protein CPC08DRAFT_729336 [Agrocybe pediades]|nr:hypothetical protein CPC08DRAFT_729336 [Agrocybe pediades]
MKGKWNADKFSLTFSSMVIGIVKMMAVSSLIVVVGASSNRRRVGIYGYSARPAVAACWIHGADSRRRRHGACHAGKFNSYFHREYRTHRLLDSTLQRWLQCLRRINEAFILYRDTQEFWSRFTATTLRKWHSQVNTWVGRRELGKKYPSIVDQKLELSNGYIILRLQCTVGRFFIVDNDGLIKLA